MRLKVLTPNATVADQEVGRVAVEAADGALTLLEGHLDLATVLVPGILAYGPEGAGESFLAVADGTLVKCGPEVLVSVRRVVAGPDLAGLRQRVEEEFQQLDEREQAARSALAKIEATFVHRFIELEHGAF
jgi:F-type H+-transporting ATPase subunit epsilon